MDAYLRLLQRQAQNDPTLVEAYIRALERAVGGAELSVWVVVFCHDETSSEDIRVFSTESLARIYVMKRVVADIQTAHREGGCSVHAVNSAETLFASGNFGELDNLYDSLLGDQMWFEISEQEILFSVPSS